MCTISFKRLLASSITLIAASSVGKRKKNPILKEYDKCYKRMYARYSSRKNLSSEKYNSWKEEAARERDKALAAYAANPSDTIIEDFKKFLGNK